MSRSKDGLLKWGSQNDTNSTSADDADEDGPSEEVVSQIALEIVINIFQILFSFAAFIIFLIGLAFPNISVPVALITGILILSTGILQSIKKLVINLDKFMSKSA